MPSYPNPVVVSAQPPRRPRQSSDAANGEVQRLTRAASIMLHTIRKNVPSCGSRVTAEALLHDALSFAIEGVRRAQ
jgi:hypothetical protein